MKNFDHEQIQYERAKKRVRSISGFYKHLAAYVIINAFLITLSYVRLDPGENFWSFGTFSTAFFWGIGLAFHVFSVFYNNVFFGKEWEDRKIKEYMDKDKNSNTKWE